MTKVINLFAGPGAGKSTTAAGLFNLMKLCGENVELVTEFAKDLTYEKNTQGLGNQLTILGEQFNRMYRLKDKVDYIITDSPLLLGSVYTQGDFDTLWYHSACLGAFSMWDNMNFFVVRCKPYVKVGRNQTEEEARGKDSEIDGLLAAHNLPYYTVMGDTKAPHEIYRHIQREADGN